MWRRGVLFCCWCQYDVFLVSAREISYCCAAILLHLVVLIAGLAEQVALCTAGRRTLAIEAIVVYYPQEFERRRCLWQGERGFRKESV